MGGETLNQINGSMPPPGASNRDRRVFFTFVYESRQHQIDQIAYP